MSKNLNLISKETGRYNIPCTDKFVDNKSLRSEKVVQNKKWRAITMTNTIWKSGQKGNITITFGDYNCDGCSPIAAWSHIGSNSNDVYPSMNLGFIDPPYGSFKYNGITYNVPNSEARNYCGSSQSSCDPKWIPGATVIHEFCHALGMMHEHQNNLEGSNPIHLNKNAVINYYNQIGMGEAGAIVNVLDTYECTGSNCAYAGTVFDPESIMMYALPDDWIAEGFENPTYPNFKLSSDDSHWLEQVYPLDVSTYPELTVKFIDHNAEPWKVAWVIKTIKETFPSIIGVKWIFESDLEIDENIDIVSATIKAISPTIKVISPIDDDNIDVVSGESGVVTGDNASEQVKKYTNLEIFGIVFGVIAIIIIIIIIIIMMIKYEMFKYEMIDKLKKQFYNVL